MEKKFVMLELPHNAKEEKNILGIITQPPSEVHNYRECLLSIQSVAARINEIRKSITGGYTLTLHLSSEIDEKSHDIPVFETISDFANWYVNEYGPKLIEEELEEKSKKDLKNIKR